MTDYATMPFDEVRRRYLADSSLGMPMAGVICWFGLAAAVYYLGDALPIWVYFIAPAAPFPLSLLIDKLRGAPNVFAGDNSNPLGSLFMRFISVIGIMIVFVIFAATEAESVAILVLGLALLSGLIWVPHGFAANDPAGLIHFVLRSILCFAAYLFCPEPYTVSAIAAGAGAGYLYALIFMKRPSSAR